MWVKARGMRNGMAGGGPVIQRPLYAASCSILLKGAWSSYILEVVGCDLQSDVDDTPTLRGVRQGGVDGHLSDRLERLTVPAARPNSRLPHSQVAVSLQPCRNSAAPRDDSTRPAAVAMRRFPSACLGSTCGFGRGSLMDARGLGRLLFRPDRTQDPQDFVAERCSGERQPGGCDGRSEAVLRVEDDVRHGRQTAGAWLHPQSRRAVPASSVP